MKGIHVQFENLTNHILKNINTRQVVENRESFDLFFQKITIQAFKIVNIIFQETMQDFTIKQSFNKLLKQLKTFLTHKPLLDDDYDDYQNNSFNEITQFMNSRKPINQVDNNDRGDIYKFLSQAQSKEKDIQEFMGNINKLNMKGSKKFLLTSKKLKGLTAKNIQVESQEISAQTDITMKALSKLQAKMPDIFGSSVNKRKCVEGQNIGQNTNVEQAELEQDDFDRKIKQLVNQKLKQIQMMNQQTRKSQNKKQDKKINNENNQNHKKKNNKRNSQININKRNSQVNIKKNVNTQSLKGNVFGKQSGFKQKSSNQEKKQLQKIIQSENELNNNLKQNEKQNLKDQSSEKKLLKQQNDKKLFEQFSSLLPAGISQNQAKLLYQSINQYMQKNKKPTSQKQVNTSFAFQNQLNPKLRNSLQSNGSQQSRIKNKTKLSKQKSVSNRFKAQDKNSSQREKGNKNVNFENNSSPSRHKLLENISNQNLNQKLTVQDKNGLNNYSQDDLANNQNQKDLLNNNNNQNVKKNTSNFLPQVNLRKQNNNTIKNQDAQSLKQQHNTIYLNKPKQGKYNKQLQNSRNFNKQNHSLDMYKEKKDIIRKPNKGSEHINLPSLKRTRNNKGFNSVHEGLQQLNTPYLKKLGKKGSNFEQLSALMPQNTPSHLPKQQKQHQKHKKIDYSKDQQRLMKQLQTISNQNSIKSNLKNIYYYIQCIQSIHQNKCGQKCIHLQKFYQFLNKKKLPTRKQLFLHKTDMNQILGL